MMIKTNETDFARSDDVSTSLNVNTPPSASVIVCTSRKLVSTRFAAFDRGHTGPYALYQSRVAYWHLTDYCAQMM